MVIGAVVIHFTGWFIIDPLISILLSLYILKEVYNIIKKSIDVLMESVPADIDFEQVRNSLSAVNGVRKVSDLHIWQTDTKSKFLSVHLGMEDIKNKDRNKLLVNIQELLSENYKIKHSTIQMVCISESEKDMFNCHHCN